MLEVSIAIPVRDEEDSIEALLESLLRQTHPAREIVIADGGSRDRTVELARRYQASGVRVLEIGPAYPGRGRNRAIEAARCDWVALIDGGCIADPRWLEFLVRAAGPEGRQVRVVYGNYAPRVETVWEAAAAVTLVPPVDPRTGCRPPFIASALVHRSAWLEAGGFPEALRAAEDLLFFQGVAERGIAVARSPEAIVRWSPPAGPRAAFRRLRLYSAHHAAAGLTRTWHQRVMAMDAALLGLLATAWLWTPAGAALLLLGAARVLRTVLRGRGNVARDALGPGLVARACLLLAVADTATWLGLFDRAAGRIAPA